MHVKYLGKGIDDAMLSKRKAILPAYVTPEEFLHRQKKQKGVDRDHLSFVDAITAGSVSSPSRTDQIVTTEYVPSPLQACFDEEVHRKTIMERFVDRDTSNNFRGAINTLRGMRDYEGIAVAHGGTTQWIYPCSSTKDDCIGYAFLPRRSRTSTALCKTCQSEFRRVRKLQWKKNQTAKSSTRQQPINSMSESEAKQALTNQQYLPIASEPSWHAGNRRLSLLCRKRRY